MNRIHSPVHRGTYPKTVCPPAINAEQQTTHPLEHTPPPALQSETTNSSNIGAYTRIEPDPPSNRISKFPERRDVPPVRPLQQGCEINCGKWKRMDDGRSHFGLLTIRTHRRYVPTFGDTPLSNFFYNTVSSVFGAVTYAFPISSVADGETGLKALCRRERVELSRFGRLGFTGFRLLPASPIFWA